MGKRCIVCGERAGLQVKNSSEFYCEECALMQFGDLALLVKVEDNAKKLKKYIDEEEFKLNIDDD